MSAERGPVPSTLVSIRPPFVDERGAIHNLLDLPISSIAVITSVAGAVRGNHYHKTDDHYCWLQSGEMRYAHRPVGSREALEVWTIKAGQMFYTPPHYEHVMLFTAASVMFAFARHPRDMVNYEADTVRIPTLALAPIG